METNKLALLFLALTLATGGTAMAQSPDGPKVILITLDGLRWQELFGGADSLLIGNSDYVDDVAPLREAFWRDSPEERREALMPFLWQEVATMGQLHGNRKLGSQMDLTNTMWFSYPGYNEILTGKADDARIHSNDKVDNPNVTLLEHFNNSPSGKGSVAAFGSWDVFPFIINQNRSGIPVNAGYGTAQGDITAREAFLNRMQAQIPGPWNSVRHDAFTQQYALEYMRKEHPRLVYIAYGETDDFAHDGDYQAYLKAAHNTDGLIRELWEFAQQDDFYRNDTVFLISTDHGRGTRPLDSWRGHGSGVKGAGQVWLVAFGKGIGPLGEAKKREHLYSNQIAPTVMEILGLPQPPEMEGRPFRF